MRGRWDEWLGGAWHYSNSEGKDVTTFKLKAMKVEEDWGSGWAQAVVRSDPL